MSSFNTSQISNASLKSEGSLGSTLMEKKSILGSMIGDFLLFHS